MVLPPPHLDVYYDSSCAPCREELPILSHGIQDGVDIRILIVSDRAQATKELAEADPGLAQRARLAEGDTPRKRLRHAGDVDGILPFARSVDRTGRICGSWRGLLTGMRIRNLLARCR